MTFADVMEIVAHVLSGYGTLRLFDGKVRDFDPQFERFDQIARDWMMQNTPEKYYRIPVLQRLFGKAIKPLTKTDLELIDAEILREEQEEQLPAETPDVNPEDIE